MDAQLRLFANKDLIVGSAMHTSIPYWSGDPSETLEFREVLTPTAALTFPNAAPGDAQFDAGQAQFDDLGDGPLLGSTLLTEDLGNESLTVPLNAAASQSLNAAVGSGSWWTGASISSVDWTTFPSVGPEGHRSHESFFTDHAFYAGLGSGDHFSLPQQLVLTLQCPQAEVAAVPSIGSPRALAWLVAILCALGLFGVARRVSMRLH